MNEQNIKSQLIFHLSHLISLACDRHFASFPYFSSSSFAHLLIPEHPCCSVCPSLVADCQRWSRSHSTQCGWVLVISMAVDLAWRESPRRSIRHMLGALPEKQLVLGQYRVSRLHPFHRSRQGCIGKKSRMLLFESVCPWIEPRYDGTTVANGQLRYGSSLSVPHEP
jgi:hypothetical protein